MWKILAIGLLAGITSCTETKNKCEKSEVDGVGIGKETTDNIQGQWDIENIVENDSSSVRPSEIEQGITAYIDFKEDMTFGIMTNCNHIGGEYIQNNNSLRLTNISSTEMACDNMETEEMLKKILPIVSTIDCINDSITRLNSDKGDSYIVLKKKLLTHK